MIHFARLEDALLNTGRYETVALLSRPITSGEDKTVGVPSLFPVPAIPTRVEYIFGYGLADGIFVRVEDYIVAGAYADGVEVIMYEPFYDDLLIDEA